MDWRRVQCPALTVKGASDFRIEVGVILIQEEESLETLDGEQNCQVVTNQKLDEMRRGVMNEG